MKLTLPDIAGLIGVVVILVAYAGAQAHRLDPVRPPSQIMNLVGSSLIIVSLIPKFNLSAFIVEAAWAMVAGWGLMRSLTRRG